MNLYFYTSVLFRKAGYFLLEISKKIYKSPHEKNYERWNNLDNKDELRYNYDLTLDSVVFDLGGYKGQWASDIFSRYCCNIYVFEPIKNYADSINKRFEKNKTIKVFDFGLGRDSAELMIFHDKDSSSLFKGKGKGNEKVKIHCFSDFLKGNNIEIIDLLKLNIEGAEYDLLDHIIECGLHKSIRNIQVQFHRFIDNSKTRMEKIQNELSKTHQLTYQTEFVWENWILK